jgi:ACS family hexuronate transporter-like MFS transporter
MREKATHGESHESTRIHSESGVSEPLKALNLMVEPPEDTAGPAARPAGGYRWVICALLFFATTINYVDRGVLGVLAPELARAIGWPDTPYGDINAAFSPSLAPRLVAAAIDYDRGGSDG